MRRDIVVPRVSESVEEGVLVTWFVEPGAWTREGDLVAEVQVEKTSAEVRAPASGRIAELLVEPGSVIVQGHPIAVLDEAEEPGAPAGAPPPPPAPGDRASAPGVAANAPVDRSVAASPVARRLAHELGVNLASIAGTGPAGRIVEADVRAAASEGPGAALVALTPMRRAIAERMRRGLLEAAQLTITAEADVTVLTDGLAASSARTGQRATYTAAIVRASALALRDHPRVGAAWTDEGLRLPERIDIGIAVALDDGLVVPVVRNAATRSLEQLDGEIADLAKRARTAHLTEDETRDAVFSVTNLGAYRIDAFTPLLNPPQTATLGFGRARQRPAVVDGAIAVRTLVVLSLTFDHRVLDGAPAAAFLDAVITALEDPGRLV
ncbi:MAG: 2-oxo acid dehydrogenase subunit E2 [Chloroflexi bacterium]|nr:2-oxo acid dehydrogenase subunit E2 [Chloroflexota bacterium]